MLIFDMFNLLNYKICVEISLDILAKCWFEEKNCLIYVLFIFLVYYKKSFCGIY